MADADTVILEGHEFEYRRKLVHRTKALSIAGDLAFRLVERYGLINAQEDGEDSAGRAKIKLMPVHDTIQRCFDLAEAFVLEADRRGHIIDVPLPEKIERKERERV